MIKFVSLTDISLGVEFIKIETEGFDENVYDFKVYAASPLFGYDKNGKLSNNEKFVFLGFGGAQVEHAEDATLLVKGRIFRFDGEVGFTITPSDYSFFDKEYKSLSKFIADNGLEKLYKEISNEN